MWPTDERDKAEVTQCENKLFSGLNDQDMKWDTRYATKADDWGLRKKSVAK